VVPLSAPALAIAREMLACGGGRWLFAAPPGPGVVDDRLRASRLWAQLKKAKKAAGVKRGTLHSFRHFFVSTIANANVSPLKVMKIVGHSSLDIIAMIGPVRAKKAPGKAASQGGGGHDSFPGAIGRDAARRGADGVAPVLRVFLPGCSGNFRLTESAGSRARPAWPDGSR